MWIGTGSVTSACNFVGGGSTALYAQLYVCFLMIRIINLHNIFMNKSNYEFVLFLLDRLQNVNYL